MQVCAQKTAIIVLFTLAHLIYFRRGGNKYDILKTVSVGGGGGGSGRGGNTV